MRPDFRNFRGIGNDMLLHSAKGSTWENHKYIKRLNGTYYYPDSYEGGRHLPDGEKGSSGDGSDRLSKDDILDKLEDITGMKREGLTNLYNLAREKGYDSAEFKSLLKDLSEGDDDQANRMIDLIKKGDSGSSSGSLSSEDVEKLAAEVIRGNFGNGQVRKELLGDFYKQIQTRVNEIMKGSSGSTKMSDASSEAGQKAVEKVVKSAASSGPSLDFEKIFQVYRKK